MEDTITYDEYLAFCAQWGIKPMEEHENWEYQYRANVDYMSSGEGYPKGLK